MTQSKTAKRSKILFATLSLAILILSIGWATTIAYYNNILTNHSVKNTGTIRPLPDSALQNQGTGSTSQVSTNASSTDIYQIVSLYKANVNFYTLDGIRKIDVDIGNSGNAPTTILSLAIGSTAIDIQDQQITPVNLGPGGINRITVDYEWVNLQIYRFHLTSSSGHVLDWPEQTPTNPEKLRITEATFDCTSNSVIIQAENNGSENITIVEAWINLARMTCTTPVLPIEIQPHSQLTLRINMGTQTVSQHGYQVKLTSSEGTCFICTCGVPPQYQNGVMLYMADTYFYDDCDDLKIDIFIGNSGPSSTKIVQAYIGLSRMEMMNRTIAVIPIGYQQVRKITLDYNWTHGQTYYFKLLASTGHTLEWQEQAPEDGTTDDAEMQALCPIRVFPEAATVKAGETFIVEVVYENIPQDPAARGFEVRLTWNSSVLEALSLEDIAFHSAAPISEWDNIWTIRQKTDQGSMLYALTWICASRAEDNGYADIYGNGTLLQLTFKALATGETTLTFGRTIVGNKDAMPVPTVIYDGTVKVT